MNCFAGCDIKSILDASGLKWKDILPDNKLYQSEKQGFNPYAVLKMLRDEVLIIGLASSSIKKGKPLNDTDHDRLLPHEGQAKKVKSFLMARGIKARMKLRHVMQQKKKLITREDGNGNTDA